MFVNVGQMVCRLALLVPALLWMLPSAALCDGFTWTGNGDRRTWEDPENWGAGRYPGDPQEEDSDEDEATISLAVARVVLSSQIKIAKLSLGPIASLGGGRIEVTETAAWTHGKLATGITIPAGATMEISGLEEKTLYPEEGTGSLNTISNSGELIVRSVARLVMMFDASIENRGRVTFRGASYILGNRCCQEPSSGIQGSGDIIVEQDPLSLPLPLPTPPVATLENLVIASPSRIIIRPEASLRLAGGSHRFPDGLRINGEGSMLLLHARATLGRTYLAPNTSLRIEDWSRLSGDATLEGPGGYLWLSGEFTGTLEIGPSATLLISGIEPKSISNYLDGTRGVLRNSGRIEFRDDAHLWLGSGPGGGSRLENNGTVLLTGGTEFQARNCCVDPSILANLGSLTKEGEGVATLGGVFLDNAAVLSIRKGSLSLTRNAQLRQSAGGTSLAKGTILEAREVVLKGGELTGRGTIQGTLKNLAGRVSPGPGLGTLRIEGTYEQARSGVLLLELERIEGALKADLLDVLGTARLDGTREISIPSQLSATLGESVEVLRYEDRQGVFTWIDGLDHPPPRVFQADYRERPTEFGRSGSLHLEASSASLPAECVAPSGRRLSWKEDEASITAILDRSPSARYLRRMIEGYYFVPRSQPSQPGTLGVTGRSNRADKPIAIQLAFSQIENLFRLSSIFSHETSHAWDMRRNKFASAEAAPFLPLEDYVILVWSGEERAYRAQSTGLDEIADADPKFERCRSNVLSSDSVLMAIYPGNPDDTIRDGITDLHSYEDLRASWTKWSQISEEERVQLQQMQIDQAVENLLASQEWQNEKTNWFTRVPAPL